MKKLLCLLITPFYKVGDPRPPDPHDYIGWHEWARVQTAGGLQQAQGPDGKWRFPQELTPGGQSRLSGI